MKVLKFGGTSVGQPERMKQVADIVTADNTPKIVVLSALSGTTNALVNIGEMLKQRSYTTASNEIDTLHQHYLDFCAQLLKDGGEDKESPKAFGH